MIRLKQKPVRLVCMRGEVIPVVQLSECTCHLSDTGVCVCYHSVSHAFDSSMEWYCNTVPWQVTDASLTKALHAPCIAVSRPLGVWGLFACLFCSFTCLFVYLLVCLPCFEFWSWLHVCSLRPFRSTRGRTSSHSEIDFR